MPKSLLPMRGVEPATVEMMATARTLLAAATNPEVKLTLKSLAEQAKLDIETVRAVLNTPAYQELIADQVRMQVQTMVSRGLTEMDTMVQDKNRRPMERIAAFRAIVATHDSLVNNLPRRKSADAQADFELALASIKALTGHSA